MKVASAPVLLTRHQRWSRPDPTSGPRKFVYRFTVAKVTNFDNRCRYAICRYAIETSGWRVLLNLREMGTKGDDTVLLPGMPLRCLCRRGRSSWVSDDLARMTHDQPAMAHVSQTQTAPRRLPENGFGGSCLDRVFCSTTKPRAKALDTRRVPFLEV